MLTRASMERQAWRKLGPLKPLLLLIALVACRSTPPTTIGNTAEGPATTVELVLVDQVGDMCVLKRVDPIAKSEDVLGSIVPEREDKHCRGARFAISPDRRHAVLWFDAGSLHFSAPEKAGQPPPGHPQDEHAIAETRRFEIDLIEHTVRDLPIVEGREHPSEIAYSRDGVVRQYDSWAFNSSDLGTKVTYLGRVLDFTRMEDGTPAVAMVDAWDGSAWHLDEMVETRQGMGPTDEWHVTKAARTSLPSSEQLLSARPGTRTLAAEERAAIRPITPAKVEPDDTDDWETLETPHGALYIWMLINEDYRAMRGRIAWRTNGAVADLPTLGFTAGEFISTLVRGRFLLVTGVGSGAYPRLYDLIDQRLVWSSDTARATIFWPAP